MLGISSFVSRIYDKARTVRYVYISSIKKLKTETKLIERNVDKHIMIISIGETGALCNKFHFFSSIK